MYIRACGVTYKKKFRICEDFIVIMGPQRIHIYLEFSFIWWVR